MNPAFFGKWNVDLSRSSNLRDFAKATGLPEEQTAMFEKMEFSATISKEGDAYKYHVDLNGAAPSITYVAPVGKAITVPTLDGGQAQMTLTIAGDTVKESYTSEKGNWSITRTVSGNEMKAISEMGGQKMTHVFTKA